MEGTLVAALAASLASMAAFALLAVMFRRGSWLFLLAGRAAREGADEQGVRALGKRMAVVLVVGSALMATLAAYLGAEIARDAATEATPRRDAWPRACAPRASPICIWRPSSS